MQGAERDPTVTPDQCGTARVPRQRRVKARTEDNDRGWSFVELAGLKDLPPGEIQGCRISLHEEETATIGIEAPQTLFQPGDILDEDQRNYRVAGTRGRDGSEALDSSVVSIS